LYVDAVIDPLYAADANATLADLAGVAPLLGRADPGAEGDRAALARLLARGHARGKRLFKRAVAALIEVAVAPEAGAGDVGAAGGCLMK
jgi:hypothetical protein